MTPSNIRPATMADVEIVAKNMRPDDVREVRAASGRNPLDALANAFWASSTVWAAEGKGREVVCVFGAAPTPDPTLGSMWMLGTHGLDRNAKAFLRVSRWCVDMLHDSFPLLFNYVDARNTTHLRWLKWIGVTFLAKHDDFGVERRPFFEFVHIRKNHV